MKAKILAICGSTRQESSNKSLIHAISQLFSETIELKMYADLTLIPIFNPDIQDHDFPSEVLHLKQLIVDSDGVLICTPEYAMGVPGALKNALDWCVSSVVFSNKPTALITSSLNGLKGHQSLMETLKIIECSMTKETELVIQAVKSKIKANQITDPGTESEVKWVIESLISLINK